MLSKDTIKKGIHEDKMGGQGGDGSDKMEWGVIENQQQ